MVLLAAADPGVAGDPGGRAEDSSARALFERGEVKFNLGNFEAAAADYQAAYELDHRPALLFNVGQCYRNLENYERARFFYRRFLTLDPQTPNRRETESLIDLMSKRLDEQRAKVDLAARASEPAIRRGDAARLRSHVATNGKPGHRRSGAARVPTDLVLGRGGRRRRGRRRGRAVADPRRPARQPRFDQRAERRRRGALTQGARWLEALEASAAGGETPIFTARTRRAISSSRTGPRTACSLRDPCYRLHSGHDAQERETSNNPLI